LRNNRIETHEMHRELWSGLDTGSLALALLDHRTHLDRGLYGYAGEETATFRLS
jgi:hypothetical protein